MGASPSLTINTSIKIAEPEEKIESPIWSDNKRARKWKPLPTLEEDLQCDVCVIGLGASGLAAVLKLLENGMKVVGIDSWDVAACAAGQNGGFLLAGLDSEYHDNCARVGRFRTKDLY